MKLKNVSIASTLLRHGKLSEESQSKIVDNIYPRIDENHDPDKYVSLKEKGLLSTMMEYGSPEIVNKIAEGGYRHFDVVRGVATHPYTSYENKIKLSKFDTCASELWKDENTHPDIINHIIDKHAASRIVYNMGLSKNKKLTSNHISKIHDILRNENSRYFHSAAYTDAVTEHPNTPPHVLHDLKVNDAFTMDRIMNHPNTREDTKEHISNDEDYREYKRLMSS